MPIDFTFALVCHAPRPAAVVERVEEALLSVGFSRDPEVLVSKSTEDPEESLFIDDLLQDNAHLDDWASVYVDFRSRDLSLGLQFDVSTKESVSGYIFINMDKVRDLHGADLPKPFYERIGLIARSANAIGGYGGFEAAQRAESPEHMFAALLATPGDQRLWFDVHLVESSVLSRTSAAAEWQTHFERTETHGFSFFVKREFLNMCRKSERVSA